MVLHCCAAAVRDRCASQQERRSATHARPDRAINRDGYLFFPSLFIPEEMQVLLDEVPHLEGVSQWLIACSRGHPIEFIPIKSSVTKGAGAPAHCAGHNSVPAPDHGPLASTGGAGPSRCDSA